MLACSGIRRAQNLQIVVHTTDDDDDALKPCCNHNKPSLFMITHTLKVVLYRHLYIMGDSGDIVPLGRPQIRWWELDENSSLFLRKVAATSDDTLVIMWSILVGITIFNSIVAGCVLMGVLLSKRVRINPFNVYLIFLMAPDFVVSIFCAVTCLLCATTGHYYSPSMCRFQAWYLATFFTINCWINGLVSYEIHRMLRCNNLTTECDDTILPQEDASPLDAL